MVISTKVQGTKYTLDIELDLPSDTWQLALVIDGTKEEIVDLKNQSLKTVQDAVLDILDKVNIQVNDFQKELMAKDLYRQVSGDDDLSRHQQAMDEYEAKKSPDIQASVVNEFKTAFKVDERQPVTTKKEKIGEKHEEKKPNVGMAQPQVPEQDIAKQMMSEVAKELGGGSVKEEPKPSKPAQTSEQASSKQTAPVNARNTSSDINELVAELLQTKEDLMKDLERVNQRMEQLDKLILKISAISNKP